MRTTGQVLFEVLESSTSTFHNLQVQVQVLKVIGRHQVHQVLFQSSIRTLVTIPTLNVDKPSATLDP